MTKSEQNQLYKNKESPVSVYAHYVYRYFGRKLLLKPKFKTFFKNNIYNKKYESILKQANMKILPDEYFITIYLTIIFLFIFTFFLSFLFFIFEVVLYSMISFFLGLVIVSIMGIFLYNYPILLAKDRGKKIDASIPYLLPYMKILAKELSLSKIIEIIDKFLIYEEIKSEFEKINYYSDFIGYDIHSSIREAMQSCPSRTLADFMNDLVTISVSGGNIYNYMEKKLDNLEQEIESIEKKNIDTLLIYSQIYVVVLLISPLFFTIMTSILNMLSFETMGSGGGIGDVLEATSSILMVLVLLPLAYAGFMMLIYYSKPLYSRLKPMREQK